MRAYLLSVLRALVLWLEGPPPEPPVVVAEVIEPLPPDPVLERAREWVAWADGMAPGTDGEYKRHQVYARLIKAFPQSRKRDLAFAIERVMQERA